MACCPRDTLCDRCLADALAQLRGVAACRGEYWARSVAERHPRRGRWPAYEGKCARIAQRKIEDLGRDARLREELARLCAEWAARWWQASGPGTY